MSSTPAPSPAEGLQLLEQVFYLQGPNNATITASVPYVDKVFSTAFATCINYASQIGACFAMLLVMLTMTSKNRYSRASTVINIAALVIGTIRCTLLSYFFTSSYAEFYRISSGDFSTVSAGDTRASNAATFFALPQLILIEAALFIQAYSMIKLWPPLWKNVTLAISVLIVLFTSAFKTAGVVLRIERTLNLSMGISSKWVYEADLTFTATTIFWFCFVFIVRIVLHMWEYRSILPPMNTVSAMEVLVMTNGVLMLVPVVFAAMQLGEVSTFEAGSLCYTSVIIVLPLSGLIAQNMSHNRSANNSGCSGVSHASGAGCGPGNGGSNLNSTAGHYGAYSRATSDTANSKKHFLSSWSHASDATATSFTGGGISQVRIQGGNGKFGRHGGSRLGSIDTSGETDSFAKSKTTAIDSLDQELALIDTAPPDHGVWVGREVEVRKDLV